VLVKTFWILSGHSATAAQADKNQQSPSIPCLIAAGLIPNGPQRTGVYVPSN